MRARRGLTGPQPVPGQYAGHHGIRLRGCNGSKLQAPGHQGASASRAHVRLTSHSLLRGLKLLQLFVVGPHRLALFSWTGKALDHTTPTLQLQTRSASEETVVAPEHLRASAETNRSPSLSHTLEVHTHIFLCSSICCSYSASPPRCFA